MTTLDSVLRIGVSGLTTAQSVLTTTSTNVANVNTPNYSRRVVRLETQVAGINAAGVRVAEVRRVVDEFLEKEVRTATSDTARYEAMSSLHGRLQSLLGRPDENLTFTGKLDTVFDTLSELPLEPDSDVRRLGLVQDLQDLGTEIARIADQIQDLRKEADRQVGDIVETVNDAIQRVFTLNPKIAREQTLGRDAAAVIEQRAQAVAELSELMDIRVPSTVTTSGQYQMLTNSGITLLDAVQRKLIYNPTGTVTPTTTFPEITVNKIDTTTGIVAATGSALDRNVASGKLRGLLDMRNTELVDLSIQLGEFAAKVTDELNRIHNDNSSVPAPNTLTGRNTGLVGTDAHGFTGQVSFIIVGSNQVLNPGTTGHKIDIDFNAGTIARDGAAAAALTNGTLGGLVSDINTAFGADGTFSLSGAGAITFDATAAGEGVVIVQGATASDRGGRGFAHYFGMNDLMTTLVEPHFDTGFVTANPHGFGTAGITTIELRGPNSEVATTFNLNFAAVGGTAFSNVLTSLNTGFTGFGTWALDSAGALSFTPATGFQDYRLNVTADTTNRSSTGVQFSQMFGIGPRYRADAARDVAVRADIAATPSLMALADIDLTTTTLPALTAGDGRGALALFNLSGLAVSFKAAGDLGAITSTISDYGNSVLSQFAVKADIAETLSKDLGLLRNNLTEKLGEVSGVNIDEELTNLIIFENAYNASARMIQTARELFDTLLELV